MAQTNKAIRRISVIVPTNPFAPAGVTDRKQCLCAMNVESLMEWWPGKPHDPDRDANKVRAIQRSLDWKRVAQIAAYLLQREIEDAPEKLEKYFSDIYEPTKNEPGREWPPRIGNVIGFQRSEFPTFSNVLLHVNGASIEDFREGAAQLVFDESDKRVNFSVIDGQHRINGAYLAIKILKEKTPERFWEIPAEVFLDLDKLGAPPRRQAQLFIDVNFYQKKVDRSLVADLFPTARGARTSLDRKERAQDLGRILMLEKGPLVGMIQIPGIKYGVKDVITLATLNSAIEDTLEVLENCDIGSLDSQAEFLAQCLSAWFESAGRFQEPKSAATHGLDPENVAYQGRVLVSILTLVPAMLLYLRKRKVMYVSGEAKNLLIKWLRKVIANAGLLQGGRFIGRTRFKQRRYLGAGGIGLFRNTLWAAAAGKKVSRFLRPEVIQAAADLGRGKVLKALASRG